MHIVLGALALLFIVLGFGGFAFGGLPTIVFWVLAAICVVAAWKVRSDRPARPRGSQPRWRRALSALLR